MKNLKSINLYHLLTCTLNIENAARLAKSNIINCIILHQAAHSGKSTFSNGIFIILNAFLRAQTHESLIFLHFTFSNENHRVIGKLLKLK